jgi:glycine dehydrogenase subunit 1
MLSAIGVNSLEDLFAHLPAEVRLNRPLRVDPGKSEYEIVDYFRARGEENANAYASFLGAGVYNHYRPVLVDTVVSRGEFLTSYTPYPPEISQGTLQALFEFQTQVALITAMDVANASMYDGATACAEAVMMANRLTRRHKAIIAGDVHPHYRETTETYARFAGFEVVALDPDASARTDLAPSLAGDVSCVVVQNPGFFGQVRDFSRLAEACHRAGALLVVVVTEAVSLGLIEPPGAMGADIVAGEGQALGNPLIFGGPHVGLFAVREKFIRQMPGRLAGETVDVEGRRGWVLTLSTREQHIRREKATSNICTNSGLCALAFAIHLALLGEAGFTRLAALNHAQAVTLADRLAKVPGVALVNDSFFNEITLRLSRPAAPVVEALAQRGVLAGVPASRFWPKRADMAELLIVAATETNTEEDMDRLATGLREVLR